MKYEVILFDADETLFDFKKSEREAFRKAMIDMGIEYDEDYHFKIYHERKTKAHWRYCYGIHEIRSRRAFQMPSHTGRQEISRCHRGTEGIYARRTGNDRLEQPCMAYPVTQPDRRSISETDARAVVYLPPDAGRLH